MQELYTEEHKMFRESVRTFLKQEALPHYEKWEKEGIVDRALWKKAGELGILGIDIAEEYGGLGLEDFRYSAIVTEELAFANTASIGFSTQNDIVIPYFCLLYTSPSPRDATLSRMPSSA